MDERPTALIVHPGARDRLNLAPPTSENTSGRCSSRTTPPTDRPNAIVERLAADPRARTVNGVFGSSDASAHIAAHLAARLGLPGPTTEAFMRCHDKLESRRLQPEAVPDATPRFFALDPSDPVPTPRCRSPLFVKPVAAPSLASTPSVVDRDRLEVAAPIDHGGDRSRRRVDRRALLPPDAPRSCSTNGWSRSRLPCQRRRASAPSRRRPTR